MNGRVRIGYAWKCCAGLLLASSLVFNVLSKCTQGNPFQGLRREKAKENQVYYNKATDSIARSFISLPFCVFSDKSFFFSQIYMYLLKTIGLKYTFSHTSYSFWDVKDLTALLFGWSVIYRLYFFTAPITAFHGKKTFSLVEILLQQATNPNNHIR